MSATALRRSWSADSPGGADDHLIEVLGAWMVMAGEVSLAFMLST